MRKKVLIITGTRAEWGLLRPLAARIRKSNKLSLRILATGMHTLKKYGQTVRDIRADGFRVDHIVPISANDSMLQALAKEVRGMESYCANDRPDVIVVLGDRDEAFAGAIVGGHLKVAVAHMHGGDTLGYLVDEAIRHSITKFAHIHFPATKKSARRLRALGEESRRIHMTGSTAFDEIGITRLLSRTELARRLKLDVNADWILAVQHPTPLDPVPLKKQILPTVSALSKSRSQKIWIYPNIDTGTEHFVQEIEKLRQRPDTRIERSLSRVLYLSLLRECAVIVGNSSSGILEAGYFGKPVVNIGGRQKGRECGSNVIHTGYHTRDIAAALKRATSAAFKMSAKHAGHPYGAGGASAKIVQCLETVELDEALFYKRIPL